MQIETQVTKNKVFKTQILKTYLTLKKKVHEYTSTDWPFPMNWSANKPQPFLLYLTIFTCNKTPLLVDRFIHSNLHSQLGQHSLSTSKPFNPIHGHRTSSSHLEQSHLYIYTLTQLVHQVHWFYTKADSPSWNWH
jgi:hypothetical protein